MLRELTHSGAFSQSRFEYENERDEERIRSCHEPLTYSGCSFHSDISWEEYLCQACGVKVWTVGGGSHWWNYEQPVVAHV